MRSFLALATLLLAGAGCCKDADNRPTPTFEVKQESYALPGNQLFPEGTAYDAAQGNFYVGSTTNGDVVRVSGTTGAASVFAAGAAQGRADCRGLKVDAKGRLWLQYHSCC